MKRKSVESVSYSILKHSIERLGGFYYKPADTGYMPEQTKNRFSPPRPCDIIGVIPNQSLIIEMKGFRELCGLSYKHLRKSQIDTFEKTKSIPGCKSLVGWIFYRPREIKKIVFVEYKVLKALQLIPKPEVVEFLQDEKNGVVLGENLLNPKGEKVRKHYVDLTKLGNYLLYG